MNAIKVQKEEKKERMPLYDAAKGICIISVVMGHLNLFSRFLYFYHLLVFFFISGLFLGSNKYSFIEFLKKRIIRLYIPYVVFSFIIAILFDSGNLTSLKYIIRIFLFDSKVPLTGTFWYVPCLFINSLIAFLIEKYIKKTSYLCSILLIAICMCFALSRTEISLYYNLQFVPWIQVVFIFAILFKRYNLVSLFSKFKNCIIILLGTIIIYILLYLFTEINISIVSGKFSNIFIWMLLIILGVSFVFSFSSILQFFSVLCYIGKASFYIMCFHFVIFALLNICLSGFTNYDITYKMNYSNFVYLYLLCGILLPMIPFYIIQFIKGKVRTLCRK